MWLNRLTIAAGLMVLIGAEALADDSATKAKPPNIVVILVDDMGFADLGCYGSEIPTPHLDALAAGGARFTQFYNTGRCCPTRAALLTGLYSHQAGVGHMTEDRGLPGYQGRLNNSCVTIAQVLKTAGYFTAITGKWHLGAGGDSTPWTRGFDRNLTGAAGGFYFAGDPKANLNLNGQPIPADSSLLPPDWYSTDLWTTYGLKFIAEAVANDQPFYLHLCNNAPHFPLQAPADEIAKFRGKYNQGWGKLRDQRYRRMVELGLIPAGMKKAPRPKEVQAWKDVSAEEQDRFNHLMAVYAATIHRMDTNIGRLVAGLKEQGVLENTLILFMSDNGGNAEAGPAGRTVGDPTTPNSNWFCGMSWAFPQNTPLRLFKHYNHEGGISTPLIAHWPAAMPAANNNRLVTTPAHLIDIMATCVDVSGAVYPAEQDGHVILPMEGQSLKPLLVGAEPPNSLTDRKLYWEHEGNAAVRAGAWKLVRQGRQGAWELYNLKDDRAELSNLAAAEPNRVAELTEAWESWAQRAKVVPEPQAFGPPANRPNRAARRARRQAQQAAAANAEN